MGRTENLLSLIKVEEHRNIRRKVSLLYTGWGIDGVPVSEGMARRRRYAKNNFRDMNTVTWATICEYQSKLKTDKAIIQLSKHP